MMNGYSTFQCYMIALKGDNCACIGSKSILNIGALRFSVDINGKLLYVMSKEGLFARPYSFAVSKYYVPVLGTYHLCTSFVAVAKL